MKVKTEPPENSMPRLSGRKSSVRTQTTKMTPEMAYQRLALPTKSYETSPR